MVQSYAGYEHSRHKRYKVRLIGVLAYSRLSCKMLFLYVMPLLLVRGLLDV